MNKWAYLLFDLAISLSLLGPFIVKVRFWERWRSMLFALGAVSLPFVIWDITAAFQNHWDFNDKYTLGIGVLGLPIEELLFFAAIPLACMIVWAFLERTRNTRIVSDQRIRNILINTALVAVALGVFVPGIYTSVVLLAAAITFVMLTRRMDLITGRRFWVFQLVALGLFLICNTYLTALPIITYNEQAIMGWYIGTIPIEDFLYNFALLNLFLICFLRSGAKKK